MKNSPAGLIKQCKPIPSIRLDIRSVHHTAYDVYRIGCICFCEDSVRILEILIHDIVSPAALFCGFRTEILIVSLYSGPISVDIHKRSRHIVRSVRRCTESLDIQIILLLDYIPGNSFIRKSQEFICVLPEHHGDHIFKYL